LCGLYHTIALGEADMTAGPFVSRLSAGSAPSLHTLLLLCYARSAVRPPVLPDQTVSTERGRGGGSDTGRESTPLRGL
jgi:hypothetical protein